jgi:hypothetical protein
MATVIALSLWFLDNQTQLFRGQEAAPVVVEEPVHIPEIMEGVGGPEPYVDFKEYEDSEHFLVVYDNQPSYVPASSEVVKANSVRLKMTGEVARAFLYVQASVDNPPNPLKGYDSVYLYMHTGETGGHLMPNRSITLKPSGQPYTELLYDFNDVPLAKSTREKTTEPPDQYGRFLDMLREQSRYFGAFVATKRFGNLVNVTIGYTCKSAPCSIEKF